MLPTTAKCAEWKGQDCERVPALGLGLNPTADRSISICLQGMQPPFEYYRGLNNQSGVSGVFYTLVIIRNPPKSVGNY